MACIRSLWIGILFACLAGSALAAPLELYGRLPAIERAAITPDGTAVAVVVTNGEERRIVVKDLVQNRIVLIGGLGSTKIRDIRWAGDDHLIVTHSETGRPLIAGVMADWGEWSFASDLDVKARKLRPLMQEETLHNIVGLPIVRTVDGRPALFLQGVHFRDELGVVSLYEIDLDDAGSHLRVVGRPETEGFVVSGAGVPLAMETYESGRTKWSLRLNTTGGWSEAIAMQAPVDTPDVLGLGRDGNSVLVDAGWDDGVGWREIGVSEKPPLISTETGQVPVHDSATGRLVGRYALVGDDARYTFYEPADARAWEAVKAALPGSRLQLESWTTDRSKVLVRADSPTEGPAYGIVDVAARRVGWLGDEYEGLSAADVSPVKPVHYKAADGFELSGYLTLPRGRDPKNLPLVVFPHGGPAARDEPGFDWWVQAMASRGYAVLQVNFRGSDGFGWEYMKAGFGEWGRKMQTDLSDGVRYLAREGITDPKRVCIVGASYGGYAALAGPTLDRGVYRCAVSFGGISDLGRFVAYAQNKGGKATRRYWTRFMGADDPKDAVLSRFSPAMQAAQADAPVLLIHGKDDTVVPLAQSVEMAEALKRAGKPVELIVENNSDHWLSLGATRFQTLQATMAFVEKNNPPD